MKETEIVFSVQEAAEGGYEAQALGHPIYTQADTLDELRAMVRDAVRCHFDADSVPAAIRLRIVRDEVIPA
ncbi:MAG: 2-oxoisovalerate dehydrogenase [Acidobacteria bacterium]|nr:MAG: 2-oxoisovalerate dehydrogenase [Acidobacteriota bacterium]PYX65044.1 MAG: 2-oxoisovalerate dehydrogenase [Acidobacteriota bacterium]